MTDIFCALLNGAMLFPRNLKTEGFNGLADWLIEERITFYHSAATIFRHFVHNLSGSEAFPDLRIVRLGGETVSWKDVESYKKHFSDNCILANELSCSEASTVSQFLVNKQTEINEIVPVGYPVEDKEILILDETGGTLGTWRHWRDCSPQSFSFTRLLEQAGSHRVSRLLKTRYVQDAASTGPGIWVESHLTVVLNTWGAKIRKYKSAAIEWSAAKSNWRCCIIPQWIRCLLPIGQDAE